LEKSIERQEPLHLVTEERALSDFFPCVEIA
jgi:hypothetical protein